MTLIHPVNRGPSAKRPSQNARTSINILLVSTWVFLRASHSLRGRILPRHFVTLVERYTLFPRQVYRAGNVRARLYFPARDQPCRRNLNGRIEARVMAIPFRDSLLHNRPISDSIAPERRIHPCAHVGKHHRRQALERLNTRAHYVNGAACLITHSRRTTFINFTRFFRFAAQFFALTLVSLVHERARVLPVFTPESTADPRE